jgi:ethanolamine utilization protein EutQ (cupin superfamily)
MPFDPSAIQKFAVQDPPTWLQVGDHEAYLGYIADEDEGSAMGLAFIRFRKGVRFPFRWAYHEVCVVTRGSLTVRLGEQVLTVRQGQFLHMPAGVAGEFDVREDFEAVCVHHPTDGKASREWHGAELLPADESIRPVDIDDVWPTSTET